MKQMVMVEWRDAVSTDGWEPETEFAEPALIRTVGFLFHECETHIVVCGNYDEENEHVSCCMTIPFGMIESITELRNKK